MSNELVAASCAAILTVYAAGYARTREEARRFGDEAQTRRPARPAPVPASMPIPVPVAVPVPAAIEPQPAAKESLKVAAVPPPSLPPATALPGKPEVPVPASVAVEQEAAPQPEADAAPDEAQTPAPDHKPWLDGYYTGWGQSRHGDIQAFVTIKDGRIINSGVAICETRYPCSVINDILLQPIDLQGPDVDRVSRATESGDAYYYALAMALKNAETGTFKSTRP